MTHPIYMRPTRTLAILTVALAAASASLASTARATTKVGQISTTEPGFCKTTPYDLVPAGAAVGAYAIPSNGDLTSWSTGAARLVSATVTLKVLRPVGEQYRVVSTDGPHVVAPGGPSTFQSQIPVEAGELIGMSASSVVPNGLAINTACLFVSSPGDAVASVVESDSPAGATLRPNHLDPGFRLNISATISEQRTEQPTNSATVAGRPTISTVSPGSGDIDGGTQVQITGSNLGLVRSVRFGRESVPFTLRSDEWITATEPGGGSLTPVPLTVETPVATAVAPTLFRFRACVVPKIRGLTLRHARKKLRAASCGVGKVRGSGARKRGTRIASQYPYPGEVRGLHTKVRLKLVARASRQKVTTHAASRG